MESNTDLLRLEGVSKQYPPVEGEPAPWVLRDVSLAVTRGESLAVTGPSGSGKSTLLNIIGGLDRPTEGRVFLDGTDLAECTDRDLARVRRERIGFVFQAHHLLPQCSAFENVLVPTLAGDGSAGGPDAEQRAKTLLERVGLGKHLSHKPGHLSGGERQRVAVVRALINRPSLLLCDEPTGALDRETSENLVALLNELNRETGVTLIVVTHSAALASRMEKRYRLRDGGLEPEERS